MSEQTISDPIPALLAELSAADVPTRRDAALGLARLGPLASEAIPALVVRLGDPDGDVRQAVARALGQMGPAALPALSAALEHPDKYVRRQAVWALGRLGRTARPLLDRLATTLDDPDPRTATGAAQALARFGPDIEDTIPIFIKGLRHTNRVICRLSARALSETGPAALRALFGPLFDADEFVRDEAICALKWMGEPGCRAAVIALSSVLRNDPDANRRLIAARTLGQLGARARSAEPALRAVANDPSAELRRAVMIALRRVADPAG